MLHTLGNHHNKKLCPTVNSAEVVELGIRTVKINQNYMQQPELSLKNTMLIKEHRV
jgi:hypothetical protein